MALQKRGKYWYYRIQISGVRREGSTRTESYSEAKRIHSDVEHEMRARLLKGHIYDYKFKDAAYKWIELAQREELKSFDKNLVFLEWLSQYLENIYLKDINNDVIEQLVEKRSVVYYEKVIDGEVIQCERKASNATINRYLQLLRRILKLAKDQWGMIDRIPKIRLLKEVSHYENWLRPEEAQTLLKNLPPHLRDMAAFALQTGLRDRNITQLKWEKVDLVNRHAWVSATNSKNKKPISIPLNNIALDILRRQLGNHLEYVFTYKGKPIERCNNSAWKRAIKKSGLQGVRFHDLRHTWASWHLQNGTSLHELQQLGGWSSYKMVLRYAHLSSDHLKKASDRISGVKMGYQLEEKNRVKVKLLKNS